MYNLDVDFPRFWMEFAVIALLAALIAYAVRHRRVPAAIPFTVGAFFVAVSLICLMLEQAATEPAWVFFWYRLHNATFLWATTAIAAFCLEYAYPGRWLTRRNLLLAALPCVVATLGLFLSSSPGLFWHSVTIEDWVMADQTPAGLAVVAYGWTLLFVNVGALSWLFMRSPSLRRPLGLLIGGQIVGRLIYALQYIGPAPGRSPDLLFLAAGVPFTLYAVGLFGYRLFDPLPGAFATAVRQMREGMLVFSATGLLLKCNPTAARILGPAGRATMTWNDIFPGLPQDETSTGEALECTLGAPGAERRYVLQLTQLADQRGVRAGLLVLLHDVTEQRAAQARVAEQQWDRAVRQEREHLAHELHDGLSQDLAYLNLQAQAAQLYLDGNQLEAAHTSLTSLASAARNMQRDMRELIGDLLFISLSAEGFYPALCHLVRRFESQTGLCVSLAADPAAEAAYNPPRLPAGTAVQVLRIVQEALSNIRRHAGHPDHVTISMVALDGQLRLTIADDGVGFDPAGVDGPTQGAREHYGLQVMRRRAEGFGGRLVVNSAPGAGTHVVVCAPLHGTRTDRRTA